MGEGMKKEDKEALKTLATVILYGWYFGALCCVIVAPFYLIALLFGG